MSVKRSLPILAVVIAGLCFLPTCTKKSGPTTPTTNVISMTGSAQLPESSGQDYTAFTVGLGSYDESLDSEGSFSIQGNEHTTGLAMVRATDGTPVLMSVIPSPSEGGQITIDARSTALAMAFLHPFVCTSNPEYAADVLNDLEKLSEFQDFEDLIESQLSASSLALAEDNEDVDDALGALILAYLNTHPSTLSKTLAKMSHKSPAVPSDDGMQIDPSWTESGHQLTWKGGDTFELTNSFGRWAYCATPSDSFFVYPNGDFLDIFKGSRPWAPSKKTFNMHVEANADTQFVGVYGYGFAPWEDNVWSDLSPQEQVLAHWGGISTVVIELCNQVLSVVTNSSILLGKGEIASKLGGTILPFLLDDAVVMRQVAGYIANKDGWELAWYLAKHTLGQVATNPSFRAAFVSATGVALTDGMISKLASWVALPIKAAIIYNSVTSVLKTVKW